MKRIFKIVLGVIGGFVLLLVLAAILLPLIFDKDDLKAAMSKAVLERTGRELRIDGNLDFSVFPWLAVEVGELSLSNAPGFGDQPFAKIGEARIGVRLMPLFRKQIQVDEISLDDLALNLEVNKQGKNNWDGLAGEKEAVTEKPADEAPSSFTSQGIGGLSIRNAMVDYLDRSTTTHYRLSGFTLKTGALGGGDPVAVDLEMLLEDVTAGASTEVLMTTIASVDPENKKYALRNLELEVGLVAKDLPGGRQKVLLEVPMLNADMAAQTLAIDSWTLELVGLEVSGNVSAQRIVDSPSYKGTFKTNDFSPLKLFEVLEIDRPVTTDPDVLRYARMSGAFDGTDKRLALSSLEFKLDQSSLTGELSVNNFARPAIRFELSLDEINLDRYLAPAAEQPAKSEAVDVEIPAGPIKGLDVAGQFTIGKAISGGLTFTDAVVGLVIKNDKLRMNPISALFYGGAYDGDITLDGSGPVPALSLNEKIENIQFQAMAADLLDNAPLSGSASGHARLTGRGKTSSALTRSLNGDIGLSINDGAYEGINIWYELRKGLAKFKGQPAPPVEPDRTVFSRMLVAADVADGVMTTRDLAAELPFLALTGGGKVDLGASQVDMKLEARVRGKGELGSDPLTSDLAGKRVPFVVNGALADPNVSVDWGKLMQGELKDKLLDKLGIKPDPGQADGEEGEPPPSVEEDLKKKAKDKLKDLFGDG